MKISNYAGMVIISICTLSSLQSHAGNYQDVTMEQILSRVKDSKIGQCEVLEKSGTTGSDRLTGFQIRQTGSKYGKVMDVSQNLDDKEYFAAPKQYPSSAFFGPAGNKRYGYIKLNRSSWSPTNPTTLHHWETMLFYDTQTQEITGASVVNYSNDILGQPRAVNHIECGNIGNWKHPLVQAQDMSAITPNAMVSDRKHPGTSASELYTSHSSASDTSEAQAGTGR